MSQFSISAKFIISERDSANAKLTDMELNIFKKYLLHIWECFNCVNIDTKIINADLESISIYSIILTNETIENIQIYLEVLDEKSIYQADLHNDYYFSNITKIDIKKFF